MKKFLFILVGMFLLQTTYVAAQEMTKEEKKAAKMEAKEAKRKAKEEAKEMKELESAEKAEAKAEAKDMKIAKLRADYEKFMENYKPIEPNSGLANVDSFFVHTNELFARMKGVEENIGFIEINTRYEADEDGDTITIMDIKNKQTGEEIKKADALKTYSMASLELTTASLQATNLALEGPLALTDLASDPLKAMILGKKIKSSMKAIKMSAQLIPLIQRGIKENSEALKQAKNN